jgi:hypothetical protein
MNNKLQAGLVECFGNLPLAIGISPVMKTLRMAPALEARLEDHVWSLEELIGLWEQNAGGRSMSPSTEVGLFTPPILAALVFLMGCGREVGMGRKLGAEKVTFLAWLSATVMILGYLIIWQKEIRAFFFH